MAFTAHTNNRPVIGVLYRVFAYVIFKQITYNFKKKYTSARVLFKTRSKSILRAEPSPSKSTSYPPRPDTPALPRSLKDAFSGIRGPKFRKGRLNFGKFYISSKYLLPPQRRLRSFLGVILTGDLVEEADGGLRSCPMPF